MSKVEEFQNRIAAVGAGLGGSIIVTSAFGDWSPNVPKGMVGVYGAPGGDRSATQSRWLVQKDEYVKNRAHFVIDTARHLPLPDNVEFGVGATEVLQPVADAKKVLSRYRSSDTVAELYDDDQEFATALRDLIGADFEYPDHSHMTVAQILARADRVWQKATNGYTVPQGAHTAETELIARYLSGLGFKAELTPGSVPGEPADLINLNDGDVIDHSAAPEGPAAAAQLWSLVHDLQEGVITRKEFNGFSGERCWEVLRAQPEIATPATALSQQQILESIDRRVRFTADDVGVPLSVGVREGHVVEVSGTSGGAYRLRLRLDTVAPQGGGYNEIHVYSNRGSVEMVDAPTVEDGPKASCIRPRM